MNYIITGLPDPDAMQELTSLYSSSPVTMYHPIAYCSSVLQIEQVLNKNPSWTTESGPHWGELEVDFTLKNFRHVYNTNTGVSEYVASLESSPSWIDLAKNELGIDLSPTFLPYMLIMKDGMQSSRTKSFCLSVSNYLVNRKIKFLIQPSSLDILVENFSPEVENAFF